ncbi:PqqD family peptide modification chaperone [Bacteroidales bacterium]|nr:PqqD family peptide modification chaperone [Bacteroidales bacterium]
MKITSDDKIKRNTEINFSYIDDEAVMLNIKHSQYIGLDSIGTIIWNKLDKTMKIENIILELTNEYSVSYDDCKSDTLDFIENMLEKELIIVTK